MTEQTQSHPAIDKRFIVFRQGRQFVLYAGLLDLAHQMGLSEINTSLVQAPSSENGYTAIVQAHVTCETGCYSGLGDANPDNVTRLIAPHCIRMAECVPLRAEILTRRGWVNCRDLVVGESVLGYSCETDGLKWVPLEEVTMYEEPRPVVGLHSHSFHAICTPEHSWVTNAGNGYQLRPMSGLRAGDSIVVAARAEGGDHGLTPRDAATLGWLLTDGCMRDATVTEDGHCYGPYLGTIYQSKPEHVAEIRGLLGDRATESVEPAREQVLPRGRRSQCLEAHRFSLRTDYLNWLIREQVGDYVLPEGTTRLVLALSQEARREMLGAMLRAAGSFKGNGRTCTFAKKSHPGVFEGLQVLATLEGWALGKPGTTTSGDVPMTTLRSNRHVTASYLRRTELAPEPVWCPTTPLGSWVMRLDGFIMVTGNTRAKARALRDATNVEMVAIEELAETPNVVAGDVEEQAFPVEEKTPTPISEKRVQATKVAPGQAESILARQSQQAREAQVATPKNAPQQSAASSGPLATPAQVRFIYNLGHDWNMTEAQVDEQAKTNYGAAPADLTKRQASDFIEALNRKGVK